MQDTVELTERERQILRLLATGTSNKDIAHQLFISSNTVKVHLRNIFTKIGVNSRTEAAMYAVHTGLVKSPATSEQENGNPAREGNLLPVSQATAVELPPRPRSDVLISSIATLIVIIILLVGAGIFSTMQQATAATGPNQATSTPESRWQFLASLPTARAGLAVAAYENQVYAIGGDTGDGITSLVERYDPVTDSWAELSQKPLPVADVNAAVIGGKIYIPGGRLPSGKVTNLLEIYDPQLDRWERGASLPASLSACAVVAFEGKLYLFGGRDGEHYLASVYEYSADSDTWRTRAPMATARAFAGAAVAGGKIYVLGGYNGKEALTLNEEYLPNRDTWQPRASLAAGRYAMGVTSIADIIYAVGGVGETDSLLPSMQYNYQKDQWQAFEIPFPQTWSYLGLVPLQTQLYAVGGQQNGISVTKNLSYQAIYTISIPVIP